MLTSRDKKILKFIEDNKSLTLQQISRLYFKGDYKSTSRRLRQIEEEGYLRSYINNYNRQKVYYIEKRLSSHDLIILDLYSELFGLGAEITTFKAAFMENNNLSYLNGLIKPDALIEFTYKNYDYSFFIEIDLTHYTGLDKFKLYEKMDREKTGEDFPSILVLRPTEKDFRFKSKTLDIIYSSTNLNEVDLEKILFE